MYANLLHGIPSDESLHDKTVWLKPTLSDGQLDSGKYRVLCFVHKRSMRCLTQDHKFSLQCKYLQPAFSLLLFLQPFHYMYSVLWTEIMGWSWVDVLNSDLLIILWGATRTASPHIVWFCHHGFLLCNIHKRKLRNYWAFLRSLLWAKKKRKFDMWWTSLPCQQHLEWLCCTHLCTTHISILGDIYFSFPKQLYYIGV